MTTVLSSVDTEQLGTIIAAEIQNYFARANSQKQQQRLLSIDDVCNVFQITRPTVNSWSKAGILQEHRIGRRVYYKQDEIDAALAKIK
jgi:excisionase family DNA binding protein